MLLTEEEAKTKWCPHARVTSTDYTGKQMPGHNRVIDASDDGQGWDIRDDFTNKCIASECMAWRQWPSSQSITSSSVGTIVTTTGYCGLAGKP